MPKYSPDFNDIEHDFRALKRARMYSRGQEGLDDVTGSYCVL
ncbi:MAG: hypothetical protein HC924_07185 [Synechococcaceae cyanobacterium SM2_3_2]|nr:hypothetical protein [Synechococcaceae cyanobacterium SM2_3_2]